MTAKKVYSGRNTPPEKKRAYAAARAQGMSISAAAREAKIGRDLASTLERQLAEIRAERGDLRPNRSIPGTEALKGALSFATTSQKTMATGRAGHGNPWANHYETLEGGDGLPAPIPLSALRSEARAALDDFALFRRRYLGRGPSPWQEDAGTRIAALLESAQESRDREFVVVNAPPGCLAGDTLITVNRGGAARRVPIRDVVTKFNGATPGRRGEKRWDPSIPTRVQRAVTGIHAGFHLRLVDLVAAVPSGVRTTYTLTTEAGRSIRATADHRFAVDGGVMVPLSDLGVGDFVLVDGGKGGRARAEDPDYRTIQGLVNHPHCGGWPYRIPAHRLVVEAERNGLRLDWYVALLRDPHCDVSSLKFLDPGVAVHHRDQDRHNNDLSNLEVVEHREHHRHHGLETNWANVANHVRPDRVVSIVEFGEEETYDLTVADDPHNFVANEFVVHNSGKSTLFTHDLSVWMIIRDRRIRILIGSRTTSQATKYTRRIRRTLMQRSPALPKEQDLRAGLAVVPDGVLVEDFGRFKPLGRADNDVWQAGGFTVLQHDDVLSTGEKEPTVTAFGFDADYMGMRVDLAVWDDLVDPQNVRTIDVIEKLQEDWDNVAEARPDPGGVNVLQGQRIRHNDLYRYNLDKRRATDEEEDDPEEFVPKYHHLVYQAHDEARCRGLHKRDDPPQDPRLPAGDPAAGCLLDPRRLPWRDLKTLASESPDTYRVVYQQEDLDPGSALVQKLWVDGGRDPVSGTQFLGCWDHERALWQLPDPKAIPAPNHLAVVVDPSPANWWACQLWLFNPASERRYLLALDRRRMEAPQLLDWDADHGRFTGFLEDWWVTARDAGCPFRFVVVEVNTAQRWLLQYDHAKRWAQFRGVNFVSHTTGVTKTDDKRGIPGVQGLWRSGRIRLPGHPGGSKQQSLLLVNEMLRWPHGVTDDQVMAHWFFEFTLPRLSPAKPVSSRGQERPSWLGRGGHAIPQGWQRVFAPSKSATG